jgi:lipopolysaccharide transport system ATP-binding protein
MSEAIIIVEGLGKKYRISHQAQRQRYVALRDVITEKAKGFFRKSKIENQKSVEDFWALKDVSFEIKRGEVVGIIGRNGAGKSTLLKILSRITEPSEGRVRIRGRVASLLEVGTGFHPELTGRENIFLNGAILGMHRVEIRRKFDEIVAFAEVEKFLDTPVKRYSSGMYVRLAFAVAAHLEPEILIVDEVLAVGDAQFQKKCMGKMQDVSKSGRTILFVSHNMGAVRGLCSRAILLNCGKISLIGDAPTIITGYLNTDSQREEITSSDSLRQRRRTGSGEVLIFKVELTVESGKSQAGYLIGEPVIFRIHYMVKRPTRGTFFLLISTHEGVVVLSSFQRDNHLPLYLEKNGQVEVLLTGVDLAPGNYFVSVGIFDIFNNFIDWVEEVVDLEVLTRFYDGRAFDQRLGLMSKQLTWTTDARIPTCA